MIFPAPFVTPRLGAPREDRETGADEGKTGIGMVINRGNAESHTELPPGGSIVQVGGGAGNAMHKGGAKYQRLEGSTGGSCDIGPLPFLGVTIMESTCAKAVRHSQGRGFEAATSTSGQHIAGGSNRNCVSSDGKGSATAPRCPDYIIRR